MSSESDLVETLKRALAEKITENNETMEYLDELEDRVDALTKEIELLRRQQSSQPIIVEQNPSLPPPPRDLISCVVSRLNKKDASINTETYILTAAPSPTNASNREPSQSPVPFNNVSLSSPHTVMMLGNGFGPVDHFSSSPNCTPSRRRITSGTGSTELKRVQPITNSVFRWGSLRNGGNGSGGVGKAGGGSNPILSSSEPVVYSIMQR
eukprot:PhF_6_TR39858/c0_g1_i2/m.59260